MNINTNDFKDINPGNRVLMGPGLSNAAALDVISHVSSMHWPFRSLFLKAGKARQ